MNVKLNMDVTKFNASIKSISKALKEVETQINNLGSFKNVLDAKLLSQVNKELERENELLKKRESIINSQPTIAKQNSSNISASETYIDDALVETVKRYRDELGRVVQETKKFQEGMPTSTITKYTDEIEKQEKAYEKLKESVERVSSSLQGKLDNSRANSSFTGVDTSVFDRLQDKINNLNTDTSVAEIRELTNEINQLGKSDNQIVRLQKAISKYEGAVDSLGEKYGDLIPKNTQVQLNEFEEKIKSLKNTLSQLQNGGVFTNNQISNQIDEATNSMRNFENATKNAYEHSYKFGSTFKDLALKIGLFDLGYDAINGLQNALRDGIQTVVDMDSAMADLAKTSGMAQGQLESMRDVAIDLGKSLGASSIDVMNAMAEYGRQYKDEGTISAMTQASILGANVMDGQSAESVAKGLTTIINSMKLEASDAVSIIDSLNEVESVPPYIVMYK